MRETNRERIRRAVDECLSGMDDRPSLQTRVLARARGERRGPRRLSLALAVALLVTLLAAAALAAGVLTGWLCVRQEDVGALHGCVSLDGTLYLSTSGGLRTWKPGQEEPALLVSMDELQAQGIGFDTLIYADGDAPALLDRSGKKLWRWQDGALVCTLDYAGTPMDLAQERYRAAVMQDGWLFLCALPPEGTVYEADVYRADPLTGDAERLPLEGVTELCAWEGGLLAVACDVDNNVCRLVSVDPESGAVHTLDERSMQGIEGVACDGDTICAIVEGTLSLWNGTGWTALQGYALGHLDYAFAVVGEGYASLGTNDMQYVPFTEAGSLPTLTIRGYISADNIDADFQQACPGVAVSRAADPSLTARQVVEAIAAGDETDLFHVRMDGELVALMREGGLAPLNESDILLADTEGMLAQVADAVFQDGLLYAVPSLMHVTVWEGGGEGARHAGGDAGKACRMDGENAPCGPCLGGRHMDEGRLREPAADHADHGGAQRRQGCGLPRGSLRAHAHGAAGCKAARSGG